MPVDFAGPSVNMLRRLAAAPPVSPSGRWRGDVQRPPWTTEARIREHCTSCKACIAVCPGAILFEGPAGTPKLDFGAGACTFCGACADACEETVFFDRTELPWALVATLGAGCLLNSGVSCRTCTDVCDERALRFDLRARPVGRIDVDIDACTGCGACVGICPTSAITLNEQPNKQGPE